MAIQSIDSNHIIIANHHWRTYEMHCTSELEIFKQRIIQQKIDVMNQSITVTTSSKMYDIGVYGIVDSGTNNSYHVYFIRISMSKYADPYYSNGKLIHK